MESPIAKPFVKLSDADRAGLHVKISTVHYLVAHERPYIDYPKLLELQKRHNAPELLKKQTELACPISDAGGIFGDFIGKYLTEELEKDIGRINYFSVLTDGSTDESVVEQEAIYIIFMINGVPTIRYLGIESVKNGITKDDYDRYVPLDSFVTIYKSFIKPHLDYM